MPVYTVLRQPLSQTEIRELAAKHEQGYIEGVVEVDLSTAIDNDLEGFLDVISEALVGNELLMDVSYSVAGSDGDTLHINVHGDPSEALEFQGNG